MKSYKLITLTLMSICIFAACEDAFETIIELDLPEQDPKIVLLCTYFPDSNFVVGLEHSRSILEAEENNTQLKDAVIELYADNNLIERVDINSAQMDIYAAASLPIYSNFEQSRPVYIPLTTMPTTNVNYRLKVSSTDYEPVEALSRIPQSVSPNQVYVSDTIIRNVSSYDGETYTEKEIELSIAFDDAPNEKNYYYLRIIEMRTAKYYEYDSFGQLVLDDLGQPILIETRTFIHPSGFRTIDPSLEELQDAFEELDPESTGESYFYNAVLFSDDLFDGQTKTLKVIPYANLFVNSEDEENTFELFVEFGTISEELYIYRQSTDLQNYTIDNPFAEPIRVYNNVENGFGIFGGFTYVRTKVE